MGIWLIHFNPFSNVPLLRIENGRGYLAFSIGCLLEIAYKEKILFRYKKAFIKIIVIIAVCAVGLIAFFGADILGDYNVIVACILWPACIWGVLETSFGRIFRWSIFQKMGEISFPLYLWHCPIYCIFNLINYFCGGKFLMSDVRIYFIAIILTVICTLLFEKLRRASYPLVCWIFMK